MNAELDITNQVVAAFLSDRGRSRYLDPYLARECSVATAAAMLGVSPQKTHYWTLELKTQGLIHQGRTEVRGRHHSRIYRSVADAFIVPLEHLPTDDAETL